MEGGRYMIPLLPMPLADLVSGRRRSSGRSGGSGSGGGGEATEGAEREMGVAMAAAEDM